MNESIYNKMSKAEREVAGVLKEIGIKWSYEHPIFVWDENRRPRVWAPVFYLIHFGIYVEVCGSKDFDYEYRRKVFDRNGYKVIFLHTYKDSYKWRSHLFIYLKFYTGVRFFKCRELIGNITNI